MSDDGFDPCECIWSNELAMQRLLSILRETQSYCTDNECFSLSRLPGPDMPPATNFFFPLFIIGFIALMFAFRPNPLRQIGSGEAKTPDGSDSSDGPPAPPTAN